MPKVKDVVSYFTQLIPPEMKTEDDNVGLLVGLNGAEVKRALIALDITEEVIVEAIRINAQMILSHHPIFFGLKQISDDSLVGRKIVKMLANGISGFCQHTNLDCVSGGVNDTLADKLGVIVEGYLEGPHYTHNGKEYGMGRFGRLSSPVDFEDYLCDLKFALSSAGLRYHNAGRQVSRVALCGGTGGQYLEKAVVLGCDTLVTADIKYHQFLQAKELGLNLIDADHFCTENVVVPVLAKMLKNAFPEIEVVIAKSSSQTAKFY
ncbi:MAG: Nif3-like dinuclear metal center hexameric protein [Clostridia bacterium]|nr:Nif3-like dinuclear metal center hexameric protein [Clostridia bacterium]